MGHRAVFDDVQASLKDGRPLRGSMFWEWTVPGTARSDRGVKDSDTTFEYVQA